MLITQGDTTRVIVFLMVDSADHVTPKTLLSPTVVRSKNGAGFAAVTGVVAEVGNGWYKLTPAAGDVDTLGQLIVHASAAGADPADVLVEVIAVDVHNATSANLSRLDAAVMSRAAAGDAMALSAAGQTDVQAALTAQGLTSTRAGYLDRLDAAVTSRAAPGAAMDLDANGQTHVQSALTAQGLTSTRAGYLDRLDATVGSRAAPGDAMDLAADAVDASSLAASAVTEIQSGLATAAAVSAIDGRIPAALITGRMDASVGAMANDVVTGAALDATADAEIADAVWDEALAGHAGAGAAGKALSDLAVLAATNLDATVGSRATPGAAMDLVATAVDAVAAAVAGSVVEGVLTTSDILRLVLAVLAGKTTITPGAPTVVAFRDVADTKDRVSADMVGSERTAVTLDPG